MTCSKCNITNRKAELIGGKWLCHRCLGSMPQLLSIRETRIAELEAQMHASTGVLDDFLQHKCLPIGGTHEKNLTTTLTEMKSHWVSYESNPN